MVNTYPGYAYWSYSLLCKQIYFRRLYKALLPSIIVFYRRDKWSISGEILCCGPSGPDLWAVFLVNNRSILSQKVYKINKTLLFSSKFKLNVCIIRTESTHSSHIFQSQYKSQKLWEKPNDYKIAKMCLNIVFGVKWVSKETIFCNDSELTALEKWFDVSSRVMWESVCGIEALLMISCPIDVMIIIAILVFSITLNNNLWSFVNYFLPFPTIAMIWW